MSDHRSLIPFGLTELPYMVVLRPGSIFPKVSCVDCWFRMFPFLSACRVSVNHCYFLPVLAYLADYNRVSELTKIIESFVVDLYIVYVFGV